MGPPISRLLGCCPPLAGRGPQKRGFWSPAWCRREAACQDGAAGYRASEPGQGGEGGKDRKTEQAKTWGLYPWGALYLALPPLPSQTQKGELNAAVPPPRIEGPQEGAQRQSRGGS